MTNEEYIAKKRYLDAVPIMIDALQAAIRLYSQRTTSGEEAYDTATDIENLQKSINNQIKEILK